MCGLAVALGDVGPALAALAHRGVRSRVLDCGGGVQMAHARLPIVGVGEEWDQPVWTSAGTLAFVGEILDFKERRPGAKCDLEVVRRAWARRGPEGFREFDGFWSVAYVPGGGAEMHLLCDYLAIKPLYYRSDAGGVGAASEPDAAAALGAVTPDEVYFSAAAKWGYCPEARRTPYREVKKVLPGERVVLYPREPGRAERRSVDALEPAAAPPAELKVEIEAAARRRALSSDVPVAALVSGGLDSAITYTLAARWGDVRPYHAENGEAEWARAVVGERGARVVDLAGRREDVGRSLRFMQEPIDLGSLEPQVALSDAIAARGAERVCLTGDGADEFFGGYGRAAHYDSQWSDVYHELVAWHLPRLDRVMMRNKIEVRSPFLARRVAQIALGLPRAARTDKKILRELFRADLPPGVADRPKRALRTAAVERDRQGRSLELIAEFRAARWPEEVRRAAE